MKGYTLILLFAFVALLHGYSFKFRDQAKETKPESKTEVADEESKMEVADQEDEEETKSEVPDKVADPGASYQCYSWSSTDLAAMGGASRTPAIERNYCNNVLGYKFTQGNAALAPGCGGCWCCKQQLVGALFQYQSLGCWEDQGRRAFSSNAVRYGSDTIQQCADRARLLGNVVFAIQDNTECWTAGVYGAKYAIYGKSTKCNNGRGGGWANSVYRLGPGNQNQKWRNLGCYKDESGGGRAFAIGPQEVNNGDALNQCRDLALKRGHAFFGLEDAPWWKRWCYTGNDFARHTKHGIESGCSDGRGGSWHVNVFQVLVPRPLVQPQPQTQIVHVVYNDEGEKVEK